VISPGMDINSISFLGLVDRGLNGFTFINMQDCRPVLKKHFSQLPSADMEFI